MSGKHDGGKARYDLLDWQTLEDCAAVLTAGVAEHGERGYLELENAEARYLAAAMRHLGAYARGEHTDSDSGKSHLVHVVCNCMILETLGRRGVACDRHVSALERIANVLEKVALGGYGIKP